MSIYYKIRKYINFPIPSFFKKHLKKYYGKNNLDQQLEKYLNFCNGFFIELGANNGLEQSNTYFFEMVRNWTGILIEPSKNAYNECKKNRPNSKCYNAACVSSDYKDTYIMGDFNDALMSSINGKREKKEGRIQVSIQVKAETLENILDNELNDSNKTIDFLSLDTEGYEFEILNGLNLKK